MKLEKIFITGHTMGFGKSLFDFYTQQGIDVKGITYTEEEYSNPLFVENLIEETKDYHVFVNNQVIKDSQIKIANQWHKINNKKNFILVNTNSLEFHDYLIKDPDQAMKEYSSNKLALSKVIWSFILREPRARYFIVAPGIAKTNVHSPGLDKKLRGDETLIDIKETIDLIDWAIKEVK